jgi:small-conductance mechanosensitive channel
MTTHADLHRPRSIHIEASALNENILGLLFCLGIHFIAYYLGYYLVCSVTLVGIYYSVIQLYMLSRSENVYEEIADDEHDEDESAQYENESEYDDMPGLEPIVSQEDRVNHQLQQVVNETRARNSKRAYESAVVSNSNDGMNVDMGTQIKTALKQLQEMIDSTRQVAEMQKRLQEENEHSSDFMKVD